MNTLYTPGTARPFLEFFSFILHSDTGRGCNEPLFKGEENWVRRGKRLSQKSNPLSISHTVFSSRFHVCLPREAGNI